MENIFESKQEIELQRLRQQLALNVVKVDSNLKGYLDRYDPDVSRATLLRLQRQKIPTKEELEKLAGVKTAKKLKGRRGKNLRGEVARAIREQKRFEKVRETLQTRRRTKNSRRTSTTCDSDSRRFFL
jgi:hypothetical protein